MHVREQSVTESVKSLFNSATIKDSLFNAEMSNIGPTGRIRPANAFQPDRVCMSEYKKNYLILSRTTLSKKYSKSTHMKIGNYIHCI